MSIAELSVPVSVPVRTDAAIKEPEGLYEIVDGRVTEKTVGFNEVHIGAELFGLLWEYTKKNGQGRAFVENMFRTKEKPVRKRRPDVAFLSAERWPIDRPFPRGAALDMAPDLAVEVVSPSDYASQVLLKIQEYFQAGVRQVWIVDLATATITVHESPTTARTYHRGDILDGGAILPGFQLTISDLLPEPEPDNSPGDEPLTDDV